VLSLLIVIGLALLVTVPPKLADFTAAQQSLNRHLQQAIVAKLASKGFDIKSSDNVGGVVVDAQQGNCHLQLRKVPAQGFNVDALKRDSKDAQLAFAYRGELSERHPTLRATISEIWSRLRWHLKIDDSWSPVVAVTAKGACGIAALPWARIATTSTD
jgi:hypothetical protein